jgi:hypothetical protein
MIAKFFFFFLGWCLCNLHRKGLLALFFAFNITVHYVVVDVVMVNMADTNLTVIFRHAPLSLSLPVYIDLKFFKAVRGFARVLLVSCLHLCCSTHHSSGLSAH